MLVSQDGDGTLQLSGESTFDIRDFGMDPPKILMLKVQPEVGVRVEIVAEREDLTMCLGIPGQVIELLEVHEHLARIDVSGVGRVVNIGLLEDEDLEPGDWVLIHVGFAMSKIDEHEARRALGGTPTPRPGARRRVAGARDVEDHDRESGVVGMRYVDEYRDPRRRGR